MRRPKSSYWGPYEDHELNRDPEPKESMTVDEIGPRAEWSGLYDADGQRLYKQKPKFGFDL